MPRKYTKRRIKKAKDRLGEFAAGLNLHEMDTAAEVIKISKLVEELNGMDFAVPAPARYDVTCSDGHKETITIRELSVKKRRIFDELFQAVTGSPLSMEAYPEGINPEDAHALWRMFSVQEDNRIEALVACCDNPDNLRDGAPLVTKNFIEENMTETDMANIFGLYNQRHIPGLLARARSLLFSDAVHLETMLGAGGTKSIIRTS